MIKCEIRAGDILHIEGYVNAVERDSEPLIAPNIGKCVEQIRAGAFGAALASGANVEILENHDKSRKLGSTADGNLLLYEDSIGLRAAADITDKEIITKARTGQLKGWSFGFIPTDTEIEARVDNLPRRIVKSMKLSEVSLIDGKYKPCYPGTLVEVRADGAETDLVEFRNDLEAEIEVKKIDYSYYENTLKMFHLKDHLYDEYRGNGKNYTKDEHGRFTGSTSGGGGGAGINYQKQDLTNGGKSDKITISGAVNGALDPESDEATEHAERYYEAVRHMKTDVKRIAQNTGFPEEDIQKIKDYVFMEKHDLGEGRYSRFDPSYEMAESWQRLIDGKKIYPHDLTLLKHESMERELMQQGLTQNKAHRKTSEIYNYQKESEQFYDKAKRN